MPLLALNHVSFVCKSVPKTVQFYEQVLGFVLIKRPSSFDFEGAWLFNHGIGIHLLAAENVGITKKGKINPKDNHISFQCSDMNLIINKLGDMNIEYVTAKVKEGGVIVDQLFFHDPDGYMIEICNCQNLPVLPLSSCPLKNTNNNSINHQTSPSSPYDAETGVQTSSPSEEQTPLHSAMDSPNANGTAAVGTGSLAPTQPPSHTPPAQTKPRYGTWMLVTRKNHQAAEVARQNNSRKDSSAKVPQATNPRQPKKNQNGPRNRGNNPRHPRKENNNTASQNNQFGILADLHDHADAPARNNSTVNDNSTSRPLPRARSKSLMHTRAPQSSVPSPQPTSTTDQPANPQATRMGSRGRGGRAGNNRGRG
nr:lactoylglutathione lyase-like [Ipomoea batatas]